MNLILIFFVLFMLQTVALEADHGPQTSAGGVHVDSAETLGMGKYSLGLKLDFTKFEHISESDYESKARNISGDDKHFDTLNWSLLQTFSLYYGVDDATDIGFSMGHYRGDDLNEGHIHSSDASFGFHNLGDVSGFTDAWFDVKHGLGESLALLGGIKLPIGNDDRRGEGERTSLEQSLQPGSGTFDFRFGLAYTQRFTDATLLNFDTRYTPKTRDDHNKIGDTFDIGASVTHILDKDSMDYPVIKLFTEVVFTYNYRNKEGGETIQNTGGSRVYISPGVKIQVSKHCSVSIAPQIPVVQNLNDEQQETDYKLSIVFGYNL